MTVAKDVIGKIDVEEPILEILRKRFAPDAIDSILQEMVKFTYFTRTDQNMDATLMKFAKLSQKAEAGMLMGSGFPDECVPVLCMQNAALAKNEKTWVLASRGHTLAFQSGKINRFRPKCAV